MSLRGAILLTCFRGKILFLVFYEMFVRFNFYGFQAILFLYLKHELDLQLHNAIGVYHVYVGLSCLVPFIGTLIADLYLNKVLSLLLMALFAIIGNILIVVATLVSDTIELTSRFIKYIWVFVTLGLLLRALGGGGAREIVRSLGDDQFQLPEEQKQLLHFHQLLHYFLTFGTIMAFVIPPILRMHLECFEQIYCFPAAFGIPAVFMLLATFLMMSGYRRLKQNLPNDSALVEFTLCVMAALGNCCGGGTYWIDNASHAYNDEFLDEMHETLAVLWLFLPLPIFWALYEQAGSRWVHQATFMMGTISIHKNWYVEPDNMQVIIPVVIFILMPIFEHLMYPLLANCRFVMSTPKQRMFIGSVLAILAFVAAGLVEIITEPTHSTIQEPISGEGELVVWNMWKTCPMQVKTSLPFIEPFMVGGMSHTLIEHLPVKGVQPFTYQITDKCGEGYKSNGSTFLAEMHTVGLMNLFFTRGIMEDNNVTAQIPALETPNDMILGSRQRCDLQLPRLAIIYFSASGISDTDSDEPMMNFIINTDEIVLLATDDSFMKVHLDQNHYGIDFFHVRPHHYIVRAPQRTPEKDMLRLVLPRGEVGILLIKVQPTYIEYKYTQIQVPVTVPMYWQVPQYILISMAAFLFPFTLMEYSYSQVSHRMRPVLTMFWFISIAFGNFLVAIFSFSNFFTRELWYYVLYSAIMVPNCMLLFVLLFNYIPTKEDVEEREMIKMENGSSNSSSSSESLDTETKI